MNKNNDLENLLIVNNYYIREINSYQNISFDNTI